MEKRAGREARFGTALMIFLVWGTALEVSFCLDAVLVRLAIQLDEKDHVLSEVRVGDVRCAVLGPGHDVS